MPSSRFRVLLGDPDFLLGPRAGSARSLLDVTRNFHLFSPFYTIIPYITAYGKIYKRDKFFRIYFSREIMELFQQD